MGDFGDDDWRCISTIRGLAVDMPIAAASGHPGAPMGLAPAAHVLWSRHFVFSPRGPAWPARDRFVLSNGHACCLHYILLHLYGFPLSLGDLARFRRLGSLTPGHPESAETPGVEVTTGPLGQGFANAVGLALADAHSRAVYNRPGFDLVGNYTFCVFGDGCAMEGVAAEAASLAGHLQLGALICLYDDNHVSIDGDTACAFTEDVVARFAAYGWHTQTVADADHDLAAIDRALAAAKDVRDRPSLIKLTTTIGYGSKLQGTGSVHGNPLKADDAKAAKTKFGLDPEKTFAVDQDVYDFCTAVADRGAQAEQNWNEILQRYAKAYPDLHAQLTRVLAKKLPDGWQSCLPTYQPKDPAMATRKLSEIALGKLVEAIPELMGGSADLTPSNLTRWPDATDFQPESTRLGNFGGRYIRYGVREHAMFAIMNGLAAYGTIIPFGGTFLNFVSYGAGAVRLSALSHLRTIIVATHDSIGLGEDGPTHQPIETVAHFRAMPNIKVWRPADGNEVSAAYYDSIVDQQTPSLICLSRQNLPHLENSTIGNALKGGYVLAEATSTAAAAAATEAEITLASTGSEVSLVLEAAELLKERGIAARVVSLPCWEVFDEQELEYRLTVLPDGVPVLSVEPFSTLGWERYAHEQFGINTFGASGPYKEVYAKFGFTAEGVAERAAVTVKHWQALQPVRSPLRRAFDNNKLSCAPTTKRHG